MLYAFEADSMIENGFLYNISSEGKFVFSKIVMDVIKFVDTSRSKQLFNDEFEKCSKEPICIARKLQG